jgi:hypothetical protein
MPKINRRSRRVPVRLPVRLVRGTRRIPAIATELNRHGMFIRTDADAELNYVVQLEIDLPNGPSFRALATARSRSQRAEGFGVEFFSIDPRHRNEWECFHRELTGRRRNPGPART